MSDAIALISFPLEEVIRCEFCRKGIFRGASRKENYSRHLKRNHQIQTENIKIKCSVCERISIKPRHSAWRDTRTHYRIEHAELLEIQQETVKKIVADQPMPDNCSHPDPRASEETEKQVGFHITDGVIDLSTKTRNQAVQMNRMIIVKSHSSLPPAPTTQWNNPAVVNHPKDCGLNAPAVENLIMKKQKKSSHSTSKIVAAMGHIFDVVAIAAADTRAAPSTSTPEKQVATDKNCTASAATQPEIFLPHVSRIMPSARPALRRSWKRRLTSPAPASPSNKKMQTCVED